MLEILCIASFSRQHSLNQHDVLQWWVFALQHLQSVMHWNITALDGVCHLSYSKGSTAVHTTRHTCMLHVLITILQMKLCWSIAHWFSSCLSGPTTKLFVFYLTSSHRVFLRRPIKSLLHTSFCDVWSNHIIFIIHMSQFLRIITNCTGFPRILESP